MQTTRPLLGASRLPLTTKQGPKHWYKGTGQSRIPGTAARSGPPGRFILKGKAKYEIEDSQVRYYVAPPIEILDNTTLKPYVSSAVDVRAAAAAGRAPKISLPHFGPAPKRSGSSANEKEGIRRRREFAMEYKSLGPIEKEALKQAARREWWESFSKQISAKAAQEEWAEVESASTSGEQSESTATPPASSSSPPPSS